MTPCETIIFFKTQKVDKINSLLCGASNDSDGQNPTKSLWKKKVEGRREATFFQSSYNKSKKFARQIRN